MFGFGLEILLSALNSLQNFTEKTKEFDIVYILGSKLCLDEHITIF